ncbi:TetR/AcrR family transcriptional regulator [Microbacterium sp. 18062]|uniref:TetR/AcrR family transcriptional regulator n=1 Tax=Microbacterium sp. 18062 TaxID=2681410 RepID=UPI0013568B9A|nr:TetR/AcrR family transcriptional regulator [Microbacterium sp. 18062]
MTGSESGLRERKKRATENAIERAAVELALERGHGTVTIADVCARADVSRSTFFNYMPSREAALFGRPLRLAPAPIAASVLDASHDVPLVLAAYRVIVASIGHAHINAEVAAGRNRLIIEQPDSQPLILAPFLSLTAELVTCLAQWLRTNPSRRAVADIPLDREASLTVSLAVGAFMALITDLEGEGDVETTERAFEDALGNFATIAGGGAGGR